MGILWYTGIPADLCGHDFPHRLQKHITARSYIYLPTGLHPNWSTAVEFRVSGHHRTFMTGKRLSRSDEQEQQGLFPLHIVFFFKHATHSALQYKASKSFRVNAVVHMQTVSAFVSIEEAIVHRAAVPSKDV